MKIKMKMLDHNSLVILNESSIRAGRKQYLSPEQVPNNPDGQYIVNFRFDHEWNGIRDIRMSVILKTGEVTAWLDVSPKEYDAIAEIEMSEEEWEVAVCVGTPPWTE